MNKPVSRCWAGVVNEEVEAGERRVRATSFLWSLGRRDLLKLAKCRLRIERKNSKRKQKRKKTKSTSLVSNNEFSHFLIFGTQCNGACRLPLDTFKGVGGRCKLWPASLFVNDTQSPSHWSNFEFVYFLFLAHQLLLILLLFQSREGARGVVAKTEMSGYQVWLSLAVVR